MEEGGSDGSDGYVEDVESSETEDEWNEDIQYGCIEFQSITSYSSKSLPVQMKIIVLKKRKIDVKRMTHVKKKRVCVKKVMLIKSDILLF